MSRTLNPRQMAAGRDMYGSCVSLQRNSQWHGSMNSLSSTSTPRRKKGKAPSIPPVAAAAAALTVPNFIESPLKSAASSPSHSTRSTPLVKKKRHAPPVPPSPAQNKPIGNETIGNESIGNESIGNESIGTLYTSAVSELDESVAEPLAISLPSVTVDTDSSSALGSSITSTQITGDDTFNDVSRNDVFSMSPDDNNTSNTLTKQRRKLIPLEASLLEDADCQLHSETETTTYRRMLIPQHMPDGVELRDHDIVTGDDNPPTERQCQKLKENKESQNKNRQSQGLSTPTHSPALDVDSMFGSNKSSYGKWKRRKGPAPALPVPPRKVLQMLPLQDIRHELDVIEVQQLGLEKQVINQNLLR